MNASLNRQRPEFLWLLLAGALMLLALGWASWTVVVKHRQASGLLADIEPRHARLAGMLQNKELLAQTESALQANFSEYVSPAEEDPGQIANAALQRVRELASARGLPQQRPALYTATVQLGVQGFSAQGTPQTMFGNLELYALKERRP